MKYLLVILFVVSIHLPKCFAQTITLPKFNDSQSTFQNYLLNELLSKKYQMCITNIGIVKFNINKNGDVHSITVSNNFQKNIKEDIISIVAKSKWSPMKRGRKAIESLPVVLPLYISIETDCKDDDIKKRFGFEKSFRELLNPIDQEGQVQCIILRTLSIVVPAGFQDINSN